MIGKTIGHYQVVAKLGEGGMGEVYRARDSKLNRDVAIKVLPALLVGDADRAARFEREAQTLAALNHPHIAQIYGVIEADEQYGLVMELVDGPTLDELIRQKMDVAEALAIARQIGLALEAAHAAGIVHRDLKPANVKVTADGTVKVLDFGLAKALGAVPATTANSSDSAATVRSPAVTQQGTILGTAAYMSPEHARGRAVDKRTDIWAFGILLYEMLTGRRPFAGDNITDVLAAVVTKEVDWSALPTSTPPAIRRLLGRTLQKDVRNRLHDIADARLEIDAANDRDDDRGPAPRVPVPTGHRTRTLGAVAAVALAGGLALGAFFFGTTQEPRAELSAAPLGGPSVAFQPKVSPDGHMLAFLTEVDDLSQVAVMKPGTGSWTTITRDRTRGLVNTLAWSTNGADVYYDRFIDAPNGIYRVPGLGGEERLVLENAANPEPMDDGSLMCIRINPARQFQLHRFWPSSGRIEALPFIRSTPLGGWDLLERLDANHVVFGGFPIEGTDRSDGLYLIALDTKQPQRLDVDLPIDGDTSIAVDRKAHAVLISARDANMFRVVRAHTNGGRPETLLSLLNRPDLDVFPSGALAVSTSERPYEILRASPTGSDVERIKTGPSWNRGAMALPDGRLLFTSQLASRRRVQVIAPGKDPVNLAQSDENTQWPFTAVGSGRAAVMIGSGAQLDVAIVSLATGGIVKRLTAPAAVTSLGASPDGKTIYWSAAGKITASLVDSGEARTIGNGDSLAVDPDSGEVIVKLDAPDGFRLERISAAGGAPQVIPVKADATALRFTHMPLSAGAVRQGRLLAPVVTIDSWYWYIGIVDLTTGRVNRVPMTSDTDFHYASWSPDGRVIGSGLGMLTALWRFEATTPPTKADDR